MKSAGAFGPGSYTCLLKKSVYKELRMFDIATSTFFRIKGIGGESSPSTVKLEISVTGVPVTCFFVNKIGTLPPYVTKTKTTEDTGLLIGVDCMSKLVKKARFISEKAQIVISLVNGMKVKAGLCKRDTNVLLANKQQGLSKLLRDWLANQTERFPEDRKNEEMKMAEMLPVQKHQETLTYVPDSDPPYQVNLSWKKDPDHTLGNNYANAARRLKMLLRKFKREHS